MNLVYPAIFYPCLDKEGAYTVEVPDLTGSVSEGDDLASAIAMATDAASGWVLDELVSGKTAPSASRTSDIFPDEGGFVSLLVLDIEAYMKEPCCFLQTQYFRREQPNQLLKAASGFPFTSRRQPLQHQL